MNRAYAVACGIAVTLFMCAMAHMNTVMQSKLVNGTEVIPDARMGGERVVELARESTMIYFSSMALSTITWSFAAALIGTGIVGAIKKNLILTVTPFIMYLFFAEILGGTFSYIVPEEIDEILAGMIVLCAVIALYRWHPLFVGDRAPVNASAISGSGADGSADYSQRVAGISRSPQG